MALAGNLEHIRSERSHTDLKKSLADSKQRGDRELQRTLAELAVAEKKGDHELAARLRASLESETPNGKQVD